MRSTAMQSKQSKAKQSNSKGKRSTANQSNTKGKESYL
jgi:hypothetical protein